MIYHYGRDNRPCQEHAYRRRRPEAGGQDDRGAHEESPEQTPSHIHQGAFMIGPSSGTERRTTAVVANRITVPTRNERAAASTGPPTTWRSWLLMANCVGAAIPAASATGSRSSQVILLTLLAPLGFHGFSAARRRRRG